MTRHTLPLAAISMFIAAPAAANPLYGPAQTSAPQVYSQQVEPQPQVRYAAAPRGQMGGGFIEFLFNGTGEAPRQQRPVPQYIVPDSARGNSYQGEPQLAPPGSVYGYPQGMQSAEPARPAVDPRYLPQTVSYDARHAPGTIVIDTP